MFVVRKNLKVMDVLKTALEWAKAEIFSSAFFIVAGAFFLLISYGFWQTGKTDTAKAYVIPLLVGGLLLVTIGVGLVYSNKTRLAQFPEAYRQDPVAFVQSEIQRVEKTMAEYRTVVFRWIPVIIAVLGLGIAFVDRLSWRASAITAIGMLVVILLIDSNAYARLEVYRQQLLELQQQVEDQQAR